MMDTMDALKDLVGAFWTRKDELVRDVELSLPEDAEVVYESDEYISVADFEEDAEYVLYLGHAGSTMWIDRIKKA